MKLPSVGKTPPAITIEAVVVTGGISLLWLGIPFGVLSICNAKLSASVSDYLDLLFKVRKRREGWRFSGRSRTWLSPRRLEFAHHLKPSITSHFQTVVNQTNVVFVGQDTMRSLCQSPRDAKSEGLACWKGSSPFVKERFCASTSDGEGYLAHLDQT